MASSKTLAELALATMREALLRGAIPAGASLKESDVCARCEVSRTPARFALNALHREGLLEYLPQRGYRVRRFDPDVALHAYLVRAEVEGLACRLAAKQRDLSYLIEALEACVEEGKRLTQTENPKRFDAEAWGTMNVQFHRAIIESLSSDVFSEVVAYLERIPVAASRALPISRIKPDLALLRLAQQDHEQITKALKKRNGARAGRLMREHLSRGGTLMHSLMSKTRPPENSTVL